MSRTKSIALASLTFIVATAMSDGGIRSVVHAQGAKPGVPQYKLDPSWPPQLPKNWVMGVPTWVAVDRNNHVFILHRPNTVAEGTEGERSAVGHRAGSIRQVRQGVGRNGAGLRLA